MREGWGTRAVEVSGENKHPEWRLSEVVVGFVDPVLAGWCEDVEGDGVFKGDGGVGDVAGDDEDSAGVGDADIAFAEVEAKGARDDVADLLVGVRVAGDDAAFGEEEAGEHCLGSVDELALEERVEMFDFDVGPAIEGGGCHWEGLSFSAV